LAARGAIAVYPVGGWWREVPSHQRFNFRIRDSLVVSLRTAGNIDLFSVIETAIKPEIAE
jgi:hypothetical protein